MTREEHTENINEIIKSNRTIKSILDSQNNRLSWMRDYTSTDVEEAYQRGLNDAWELARRIRLNVEDGGISVSELCEMFHTNTVYNIFKGYSAQEVMKRIAEYEKQKNAIKIGDEVKFNHDDIKATVMDQSDKEGMWWLYTENGCIEEWQDAYFRKTGRTFPQIEEVLKAMQEKGS